MDYKDDSLEMEAADKQRDVKVFEKAPSNESMVKGGKPSDSIDSQVRIRRLFSFAQIFAFSLTFMGLWEGMFENNYFALYQGGPAVFIWSNVVAFCGALGQAASLAEMASIIPIAGAQYHWTWHLAPKNVRRFATYLQGWVTWFGFVSLLAGIANVTIILLLSIINYNIPSYTYKGWHISLCVIAMNAMQALLNMYAFKAIPWIEMVAGVLHVCLFIICIVVLAVLGRHHSAKWMFTDFETSSGWNNKFIAFNLGALTSVWSYTGFDSAIHMSEEVRKAKSAVPRGIFWSIFMNGILAFIAVVLMTLTMGEIAPYLAGTTNSSIVLFDFVTHSKPATTAIVVGLFIIAWSINLACIASVSRLSWAWARDGGLPKFFAYVDPKHRVPVRAVWLVATLVSVICLLNIGAGTYIAVGAITSLSSLALYISYAIAIASMLYARYINKAPLRLGEWNLGRFGGPINVFAWVYTVYMIIWLPFPGTLPVTGSNMNYAGAVMGAVIVVALSLWLLRANKHWSGPNLTIMEFISAQA